MQTELLTVLVIEDSPEDIRLIRDMLDQEPSGRYNLLYANRLDSGLERLAKGGISTVLLDLSLPDSNGIDTFNRVHAHSPDVPIIVLTALNDRSIGAEILRAGGQDFLDKGFVSHYRLGGAADQ
jgi:CheY-like chemotaxis protein